MSDLHCFACGGIIRRLDEPCPGCHPNFGEMSEIGEMMLPVVGELIAAETERDRLQARVKKLEAGCKGAVRILRETASTTDSEKLKDITNHAYCTLDDVLQSDTAQQETDNE